MNPTGTANLFIPQTAWTYRAQSEHRHLPLQHPPIHSNRFEGVPAFESTFEAPGTCSEYRPRLSTTGPGKTPLIPFPISRWGVCPLRSGHSAGVAGGAHKMNTETLTDTNRLAYITSHEAQKPSGSGPRAQGWACSDEEDDSRAADQTSATSGQCALEQGERKGRVTRIRRPYMTRGISLWQSGHSSMPLNL